MWSSWLFSSMLLSASLSRAQPRDGYELDIESSQLEDSVPYWPIVVPLAVRGPYLGAYLTGRTSKNLATMSPHFWSTAPLGWTGLLRVDGETFNWMGNLTEWPAAANTSFASTASDTTFEMQNGDATSATVALTATFLSPTTPADLFRQSLPFSYLTLSVRSLDGEPHEVEVYSDINGLWTCNMEGEVLKWDLEEGEDWTAARFQLKNQRMWQEDDDRLLQGDVWYVARTTDDANVTVSAGHDALATRSQFAKNGTIPEWFNSTYRAIRTRDDYNETIDEPVFAIAHSFGTISPDHPSSALISIGYVRDPIVQYAVAGDTWIPLRPYWLSRISDVHSLVDFFINDYETARGMSTTWNEQLYDAARLAHSQDYAHILAVSTRQIFMAIEAAWDEVGPEIDEEYDLPHVKERPPMMMLKEISSNGNCQTVDVIAPFLPFMVYANPALLSSILEPVYRYVRTGQYRPVPPPHDMGDHYPNATGRNDYYNANLPLEEAGNMLNMAYAGVILGRDGEEQASRYYSILKKWVGYLETDTLYPGNQRSTDDFFGASPNQTSLVIKGIVAIKSFAEIAGVLGHTTDRDYYRNLTKTMTDKFLEMAVVEDGSHLMGAYGKPDSWMTQYNLFYDKLLGTEVFPASIYDMQDRFYPTIAKPYGPPLDSRFPTRAKTDWLLWTAGASTLRSTRDIFVYAVAKYFQQSFNAVMGDSITPEGGWSVGFLSRPVAGGHYSLVAMEVLAKRRAAKTRLHPTLPTITELVEHADKHRWMYVSLGLLIIGLLVHLISRRSVGKGRYAPVDTNPLDRDLPPLPYDMPRLNTKGDEGQRWSPGISTGRGHARRRSQSSQSYEGVSSGSDRDRVREE